MPSSFDWSHMYCHLQLGCDFFCEQWEKVTCRHVFQLLIISKVFIIIFFKIKIFCFHDWMVLNYDMWCNRNLSRDILIEFVKNKFKSIFKYVGRIHTFIYLNYIFIQIKHIYLPKLYIYLGMLRRQVSWVQVHEYLYFILG